MRQTVKRFSICAIFGIISFGLMACSGHMDQEEAADIVNEFHNCNYEYIKTSVSGVNDDVSSVFEGRIIANPYEEYYRVSDDFSAASVLQEAYISGAGSNYTMQAKDSSGNIVVQQNTQPSPRYGYGEDLSFTFDRTETIDGAVCEVYKTEYQDTAGGEPSLPNTEEVEFTIRQEYYINPESRQVVRVDTDLEDRVRANEIIMIMQNQNVSLEEAGEQAENRDFSSGEILEVFNIGGNIQVEPLQ